MWSVSEGIYRSIFLEGDKGVIAFDTLTTPGTARAYAGAIGPGVPDKADTHHRLLPRPSRPHRLCRGHGPGCGHHCPPAVRADVVAARKSDGQTPATEVWDGERKEYEIDGVYFELLYPGPTHGDGKIARLVPAEQGVVHGGHHHPRRRLTPSSPTGTSSLTCRA